MYMSICVYTLYLSPFQRDIPSSHYHRLHVHIYMYMHSTSHTTPGVHTHTHMHTHTHTVQSPSQNPHIYSPITVTGHNRMNLGHSCSVESVCLSKLVFRLASFNNILSVHVHTVLQAAWSVVWSVVIVGMYMYMYMYIN